MKFTKLNFYVETNEKLEKREENHLWLKFVQSKDAQKI